MVVIDLVKHTDDESVQLLRQIASGSERAMREFYNRFERTVYTFSLSRLNDPHIASDLVNEVMLAVWNGAERFREGSKVKTWLLGIARYKVIDQLRKRKHDDFSELDDEVPDDTLITEELLTLAEDRAAVRDCLERLSATQREVMQLVFYEELHYREVAELTACPEGTVKTRVYHAKQWLKKCLERWLRED
ncbi:MAG TPA: sigma-70 family RNA polymerase sigma factor [Gammaproteobacteria bacterium]|nr:sigma-70 family RNA polymerase sigma factor [Gammaproteobacteria bacterium]